MAWDTSLLSSHDYGFLSLNYSVWLYSDIRKSAFTEKKRRAWKSETNVNLRLWYPKATWAAFCSPLLITATTTSSFKKTEIFFNLHKLSWEAVCCVFKSLKLDAIESWFLTVGIWRAMTWQTETAEVGKLLSYHCALQNHSQSEPGLTPQTRSPDMGGGNESDQAGGIATKLRLRQSLLQGIRLFMHLS